ncbi:MAG: hypothetical protein LBI05_11185 [Planctomycetaceae bacterium]|jgi:hypothetical protein|nr:hypothetical protein [Planctomycetaceae bacterium]
MPKSPILRRLSLLLLLITLAAFNASIERGIAQDLHTSLLPLKPDAYERIVTKSFISSLEDHHISHRPLDSSVSKEAFRLYIKSLD